MDEESLLCCVGEVEVRHGLVVSSNEVRSDYITGRIINMNSDIVACVIVPSMVRQIYCNASVEPVKGAATTQGRAIVPEVIPWDTNIFLSDEVYLNWNGDWGQLLTFLQLDHFDGVCLSCHQNSA